MKDGAGAAIRPGNPCAGPSAARGGGRIAFRMQLDPGQAAAYKAVSYTHLTLPTIYSV